MIMAFTATIDALARTAAAPERSSLPLCSSRRRDPRPSNLELQAAGWTSPDNNIGLGAERKRSVRHESDLAAEHERDMALPPSTLHDDALPPQAKASFWGAAFQPLFVPTEGQHLELQSKLESERRLLTDAGKTKRAH